jgi:hypothetical protein
MLEIPSTVYLRNGDRVAIPKDVEKRHGRASLGRQDTHLGAARGLTAACDGVSLTRIHQGCFVKVNLLEPLENEEAIPQEVGGVRVVVEIVGRIVACQ